MERKTNINNLNIVWQGQSWSVIAPTGDVIARFKEKQDAIRFAEITKDYSKKQSTDYAETGSPLPFDKKPKSKFSYFDGEINIEKDDQLWSENNVVVEKVKNTSNSSLQDGSERSGNLLGLLGLLAIAAISVIVILAARSLVSEVGRVISSVFSVQNIFFTPQIIPILGIASIIVPLLLLGCIAAFPEILRKLVGIPLTLLGLVGLLIGVIAGIVYFILSIFSADYDTGRILITFGLWLWVSFCMTFLGVKMVNEF